MGHVTNVNIVVGHTAFGAVSDAVDRGDFLMGARNRVDVSSYRVRDVGLSDFEAGIISEMVAQSDGPILTSPVVDTDSLGAPSTITVPNDDDYKIADNVVMDFIADNPNLVVTGFKYTNEEVMIDVSEVTTASKPVHNEWYAMIAYHI